MIFTIEHVGSRMVDGVEVEISDAEKQTIVDEWNTPPPPLPTNEDLLEELFTNDEVTRKIIKALALTMKNEINLLRAEHGLAPRTTAQLKNAIHTRMS